MCNSFMKPSSIWLNSFWHILYAHQIYCSTLHRVHVYFSATSSRKVVAKTHCYSFWDHIYLRSAWVCSRDGPRRDALVCRVAADSKTNVRSRRRRVEQFDLRRIHRSAASHRLTIHLKTPLSRLTSTHPNIADGLSIDR